MALFKLSFNVSVQGFHTCFKRKHWCVADLLVSLEGEETRISKDALLSGMDSETLPLRVLPEFRQIP